MYDVQKCCNMQRGVSSWDVCSYWCFLELMSSYSPACTVPRAWMCISWTERGSKDTDSEGGEIWVFFGSFTQFLVRGLRPRQGYNFTMQHAAYMILFFTMFCPGAQTKSLLLFTYRFQLFPHTVELIYQNSLLQTSEELVMVVVGPLTLNAGLLLMVLIRWVCQQLFDSYPSFLSKFIIAMGLWTVLDPLAVFIVDSFLGVSHLK